MHGCGERVTCILSQLEGSVSASWEFFYVTLGDGSSFHYWMEKWLVQGSLLEDFPRVFPWRVVLGHRLKIAGTTH